MSGARSRSWETITWIADALAVLRAPEAPIDWARFVRQARHLRATLRVLDAVSFLCEELAAPVPSHVLGELRETPVRRRELLAHRTAAARWPGLGPPPEILTRFLRLTADESIPRALARGPAFLREEWGLERSSQVPLAAARKGRARVAGRRALLGAESVRSRGSRAAPASERANAGE